MTGGTAGGSTADGGGPHRVLSERYELHELLGRGGMASVYAATDARLGRAVAVKVLREDLARDPAFQARFRREAQSAAALNHPAVVAVYDTGDDLDVVTGQRVPYIVMERVHGVTARELLDERSGDPEVEEPATTSPEPARPYEPARRGGVGVPLAVTVTEGVLSALAYSHRAGIVHRDIKPANVMLTPDDDVKVMDFGIARALADTSATMTQTHAVLGTAHYLSPEQARGAVVDARSDLYSTGCLLYELLTGTPPFTGDSAVAVAYQHVSEAPRPPSTIDPSLPAALDDVVLRALAKDREDRFDDATAFRDALVAAARDAHVASLPSGGVAAAATTMIPAASGASSDPDGAAPPDLLPPGDPDVEGDGSGTRGRRGLLVTLGLLLLLLAAAALVLVPRLGDGSSSATPVPTPVPTSVPTSATTTSTPTVAPEVSVPVLTGLTVEAARSTLDELDLQVAEEEQESAGVAEGRVSGQDPVAGTNVPATSTVTLTVSTGPGTRTVPDLSGRTLDGARGALESVGLGVGETSEGTSPQVPEGSVVSTDPGAGERVTAGSTVDLVVSDGQVEVGDLTGQPLTQVRPQLVNELRLVPEISYEPSDAEQNTVLRQDPPAGLVPQGSTIDLVVASPPVPTATPTSTPSTTPTAVPTTTPPPTTDRPTGTATATSTPTGGTATTRPPTERSPDAAPPAGGSGEG